MKKATQMQIRALEQQRAFVFKELEPGKVAGAALQADINRARERLALQAQIDPELYAARRETSKQLREMAAGLGTGSPADLVSRVAAVEGVAGVPGMQEAKSRLVDTALQELEAGATLPPDVQAELVKAGLEKTGMVTGSAGARGVGGTLLRKLIGTAGTQLQAERQTRAADLLGRAQQLEESRQNLLGSLFPRLQQTQLANLAGVGSVLEQTNRMVPEAGLGGTDIANIWMARVGATNQLAQSAADAAARGAIGAGQIWGSALGSATRYAGGSVPSTYEILSKPKTTAPATTGSANTFTGASGTTYTADASGAFG